ncbi:aconitate hydratase AcnA [Desulfobacter hydrogenophilus]|uniref:Aconitate hydratase n=1 Tax=Desulfobacter hydrogenophilus TaxID=2291 RepID=A0A328FHD3_9BACT|nr:aconitate hydratase AcnA [Desulfobacter hydrogenophilus]NDY73179.1 aconitate hydratase AcnA [Desulfobacter hydrogenophilus]QBH12496.1 aconitate hydratase AcnA [Desulfobacter hydrogenophilus]RAM03230.1 aconitate hydratase AcnA [Desulfobacter hydrogenophilus]
MDQDKFGSKDHLKLSKTTAQFYKLENLEKQGIGHISGLPFSIKILLEQTLRNLDHFQVNEDDIVALANWQPKQKSEKEIPFKPARVVLQDLTGVPALVDLAALRTSMSQLGGNPAVINPKIPVDLIIDHSIQVDSFGMPNSLQINMEREFERNRERYEFLKWGQKNFKNMRIFPPGVGIVHQVNLEFLANVVQMKDNICFSDTLVGTDSHTPMVNSLGVLGWGVGGIEAESVMLGQPIYMQIPEVVGFKLTGKMNPGTTATDLVFRVVQILRDVGVVEKFVEFYGDGLSGLSLPDRATISNMAPEYGATIGFFPTDNETLHYLKSTGRSPEVIERVEHYCKAQGLFRTDGMSAPGFSDEIELDLSTIEPSMAGPKRPQDRIGLSDMKHAWAKTLTASVSQRGYELKENELSCQTQISLSKSEKPFTLAHGSVVLAAITSCTNTSNPFVMIAAGLLAKKAVEKGLKTKPWVKTSLAPGSRVVTDYLQQSKLDSFLEQLGFFTVGYGCTSCIGNSGPFSEPISKAIIDKDLVVASVLSGNRNFEGRVHALTKANYLASPPLVVAYAIAGTININLLEEPLGTDQEGQAVYLKDIWPDQSEISEITSLITPEMYLERYSNFETLSPLWNEIPTKGDEVYEWDESSTYIRNPPFFLNMSKELKPVTDIVDAKVLVKVGDSVTTDHISPAGAIAQNTPAAAYLLEHEISHADFNSYGSRRGNDQVMVRGTFANIRLRNQLAPGTEGGITTYLPSGEQMSIFEASEKYKDSGTPLIVLAGKEYGTGSSRDWAAKGTYLLGVKAVIATSYERIHRSNLLGMGVLPLQFKDGNSPDALKLTGKESYSILGLSDGIKPGMELTLKVDDQEIPVRLRLDTPVEIEYYQNGGILHTVLRNFMKDVG